MTVRWRACAAGTVTVLAVLLLDGATAANFHASDAWKSDCRVAGRELEGA